METYYNVFHRTWWRRADAGDIAVIKELVREHGETAWTECEALDTLLCNSELDWIDPDEIDALTSAPILGLRGEDGTPIAAWGFMDYKIRSFLTDLTESGEAVFVS